MNILFICSSNTCRSPYAELYFKKLVSENDVLKSNISYVGSSAVFNKSKAVHPRTYKLLLEEGVDEEQIKAFAPDFILLNRKKFDDADIIIGMGLLQKLLLPVRYHKKYLTLSQAAIDKQINIPDPFYRKSEDFYRKTMDIIKTYLQVYATKLEAKFQSDTKKR